MVISRHNSTVSRDVRSEANEDHDLDQVFVVNGVSVSFYLYGTNEEGSSWALSAGRREALAEKIKVSPK